MGVGGRRGGGIFEGDNKGMIVSFGSRSRVIARPESNFRCRIGRILNSGVIFFLARRNRGRLEIYPGDGARDG